MRGIITKIDPIKKSFNGQYTFQRIRFKLEDGKFAKTDLCPTFRNYRNWKPIIDQGVGTEIQGLRIKGGVRVKTIDADSEVRIYTPPVYKHPENLSLFDE